MSVLMLSGSAGLESTTSTFLLSNKMVKRRRKRSVRIKRKEEVGNPDLVGMSARQNHNEDTSAP